MTKFNVYKDLCPCNSGKKIIDCCYSKIVTTPPSSRTGYSHSKCYAKSLCDCSKTISREHYVSRSLLDLFEGDLFQASGFSWIHDSGNKLLSKKALSSNILCQRHNTALSGLDTLAKKYFRFVLGKTPNQSVMIVRGSELERWMLKIYCGVIASGTIKCQGVPLPKILPSRELLDILFYRKEMPPRRGLIFELKKTTPSQHGLISWSPLLHDSFKGPIGFMIQLEFFTMILAFGMVSDYDKETERSRGHRYHPESLGIEDNHGYREVHFGWPSGSHIRIKGHPVDSGFEVFPNPSVPTLLQRPFVKPHQLDE